MLRSVLLILVCSIFTFHVNGQSVNLSDSLKQVFRNKPFPVLKLDFRNSFVTGKSAQIGGIKAGASFGPTMSVGLGYSWLHSDFFQEIEKDGNINNARVTFRFVGPFVEYSFFRKYPWEAMVTAQAGVGKIYLDPDGRSGSERIFEKQAFIYEPTIGFEYKIANLIGLGLGYGYRLVLHNSDEIEQQFTAPVFVLRTRIIFDKIWPIINEKMAKN